MGALEKHREATLASDQLNEKSNYDPSIHLMVYLQNPWIISAFEKTLARLLVCPSLVGHVQKKSP